MTPAEVAVEARGFFKVTWGPEVAAGVAANEFLVSPALPWAWSPSRGRLSGPLTAQGRVLSETDLIRDTSTPITLGGVFVTFCAWAGEWAGRGF